MSINGWINFLLLWTVTLVAASSTSNHHDDISNTNNEFQELSSWIKEHGGRVDERFHITIIDGVRGGEALDTIKAGTELLFCPWKLVIGSENLQRTMQGEDHCQVLQTLQAQQDLGKQSLWYPYLKVHQNITTNTRPPAIWDSTAALKDLQGLPPTKDVSRSIQWLQKDCGEELGENILPDALWLFVTRVTAVGMVPLYDSFNHHNGLRNVQLQIVDEGVALKVILDIPKGKQIHTSYGIQSAFEIFRDYGFVESWPQLWEWRDDNNVKHTVGIFAGVPVLYPDPSFLNHLSSASGLSLSWFQNMAKEESAILPQEVIRIFKQAATEFLQSLPTTIEQDENILEKMKIQKPKYASIWGKFKSKHNDVADVLKLGDSKSAVEYRIAFKKGVRTGLDMADRLLLDIGNQDEL